MFNESSKIMLLMILLSSSLVTVSANSWLQINLLSFIPQMSDNKNLISSETSWMNYLILMTWQKMAPFMLISYLITKFMFLLCIFSSIVNGSMMGLNQTSLRKLMAYSSINHLGWMLASMQSSESMWMIYFLFYSFLSLYFIFLFNMFNFSHLNQLFSSFFNNKMIK